MVKLSCFGAYETAADDWDAQSNHSVESAPPTATRLDKAAWRAHALFPHKRVLTRQAAKQRLKRILNVKKDHHDRERPLDDDPEYLILGKIYSELDASVDLASLARNRTTLSHLLPFLLNALLYGFNDESTTLGTTMSTGSALTSGVGGVFYGSSSSNRSAKKGSNYRVNNSRDPTQITLRGTSHLVKAQCERQLEEFLFRQAMNSVQFALECVWYLTTSLSMGPKESYHRTMTLLLGMESVVATSASPGDLFKKAEVTETPSTQLNTEPNSENTRIMMTTATTTTIAGDSDSDAPDATPNAHANNNNNNTPDESAVMPSATLSAAAPTTTPTTPTTHGTTSASASTSASPSSAGSSPAANPVELPPTIVTTNAATVINNTTTITSGSPPSSNRLDESDLNRLMSKRTVREVDLDIAGSGANDHRMQFNTPLEGDDEQKLQRWLDARRERANVFHAQLDFVKCLTHISQELFDVEREFRRDVLRRELEKLNDFIPKNVFIPTDRRPHRVLRIVPDTAHVFSTKERAPYLLVLEVEDLGPPPPPPTLWKHGHAGDNPFASGAGIPFQHQQHAGASSSAAGPAAAGAHASASIVTTGDGNAGGGRPGGPRRLGSLGGSHSMSMNNHNHSSSNHVNNHNNINHHNHNPNHHTHGKGFFGRNKSAIGGAIGGVESPAVFSDDNDDVGMALQNKPDSKFEFSPDVTAEVNKHHHGTSSVRHGADGENDILKRESSFRVMADGAHSDDRRPPDEELLKALGEKWPMKSERLRKVSPFGHKPNWRLVSCIVKARDQLRQEMFAQRLIQEFARIFDAAGIPLWLRAYEILSTSHDSGLIETVTDALSIDSIKKQNKKIVTLQDYFFGRFGGRGTQGYKRAVRNFVQSMAGYSIVQYLLNIKDRHNGNLMIDADGHVIHIDFGFLLSNSPGGNMEFEKSPFKLTNEMVQVMGGAKSSAFKLFKKLCVQGYLEACRYANKILLMVDIMYPGNETMPCFLYGREYVLQNMRERFGVDLTRKERATKMLRLIQQAHGNWTTKAYDQFQKVSLGIAK